ncbi:hypothetical protein [Lentzea sp.]|uniref:hypothetical protein n=1 Tax=Lentzea sp. TaxID=56099 RepID=UPI002C622A1C|nr:hypothetical protein [Lentzea sp.]HUQ58498.1 hypothetical protein [Lentzea sp.]
MTWQDELQKLDNELASGRISADDYRRRRDEVLSGSAGGGPVQNPQSGPFAPPFKWEAQPPNTSDRTQVVNVQGQQPPPQQQQPQQNPNPDATQVVPGSPRNGGGDAERTQFVTPVQPQQGGWGQPQQQAAPPPWLGGDFDQINQPPSWSHGPEVFDESGGGGGKGKIFAIIGVVLVLALIGGGIWWFTAGSKSNDDTATSSTAPPPSTTSSSAGPKLPLNGLSGKVDAANTGPVTVEKASKEKSQFSPDEAGLLTTCGAENGMSQVLFADDWFTQVHVFTCTDGAAAKTAADALSELQKGYGFTATTGPKQLPSMVSEKATDVPDAPFDSRIFYVSNKSLVRVEVRGKTKAAMDSGADKVVTAIEKNYPAK